MAPALACEVAPMPVADDLFVAPPDDVPREGLLFVGRLTAQKGVDVLLHALSLLPGDETLSVIGDGPESDALRALATSLGVADRVRWMGALARTTWRLATPGRAPWWCHRARRGSAWSPSSASCAARRWWPPTRVGSPTWFVTA
jgi:glycosyltransferase involved in cell wall biosynthesis